MYLVQVESRVEVEPRLIDWTLKVTDEITCIIVYLRARKKNNCNFRWANIGCLSIKLAIEHAKWLSNNMEFGIKFHPPLHENVYTVRKNDWNNLMRFLFSLFLFPVRVLQFWCWKWTRSTITAGRWFAERRTRSTKSSTTPWIISVSIWFRLWNVAKINVEKFQHRKRKVSQLSNTNTNINRKYQ